MSTTPPMTEDLKTLSERAEPALRALLSYEQADEDGVMVLVSRQAIHEVSEAFTKMVMSARSGALIPSDWVEGLRAENERLRAMLQPDMFWDSDNPDCPHQSVEELVSARDYGGEGVVEVLRGVSLPSELYCYQYTEANDWDETGDFDLSTRKLNDDQYQQFRACERIGSALREMGDRLVEQGARRLYDARSASDLGLRHKYDWNHVPWAVRKNLETEARTALSQGEG